MQRIRTLTRHFATGPSDLQCTSTAALGTTSLAVARARIGLAKHELPTPSLLLDLDRFNEALAKMCQHARRFGKSIR